MGRTSALLLLLCAAGCIQTNYGVTLRLSDTTPSEDLRFQVSVVASCDIQPLAERALAPVRSVSFDAGTMASPLGDISPGRYGLHARAMNGACKVVAAGCTPIHVKAGGSGQLYVELQHVEGAACSAEERCEAGRCLPPGPGQDAGGFIADGSADVRLDGGMDAAQPDVPGLSDVGHDNIQPLPDGGMDADEDMCPLGSYRAAIIESGPVHYYALDDAVGSAVAEGSTAETAVARIRGAARFGFEGAFPTSGTSLLVTGDSPDGGQLRMSTVPADENFSVELWLYPVVSGVEKSTGVFIAEDYQQSGFRIRLGGGIMRLSTDESIPTGGAVLSAPRPLPSEEWTYIVWTVGEEVSLYFDGEPVATFSRPGYIPGGQVAGLGAVQSQLASQATDELAYYDRALTPIEIRAHYDAALGCR